MSDPQECRKIIRKRERDREYARRRRAAHPETVREQSRRSQRKRRAANLEKARERERESQRKRRALNLEQFREQEREKARRWRAAHPEQQRETARQRYAANPEPRREQNRARYAERGGNAHRNDTTIAACLDRDGSMCSWCGEQLGDPYDGQLTHLDHILPPAQGGTSNLSNLQLLHASCNESKGDRPMDDAPAWRDQPDICEPEVDTGRHAIVRLR